MTKALAWRPLLGPKPEVLLELEVHPTLVVISQRSDAGGHVSQLDRLKIKCLEAGNYCNALVTVYSL
jgi:hypothetical protein